MRIERVLIFMYLPYYDLSVMSISDTLSIQTTAAFVISEVNNTCIFIKYFLPDFHFRIFLVSLIIADPTGGRQNI